MGEPRADDAGVAFGSSSPAQRTRRASGVSGDTGAVDIRKLHDITPLGVIVSSSSGAIIDANDAFLAMIGYSRAELRAGLINWRKLTPPQWSASDDNAVAEMAAYGIVTPYLKEYIHKDGHRVPISLGGARIADSDDEKVCYIVDRSAVQRTEAELFRTNRRLLDSEQRARVLADEFPQIVIFADEDHRLIYANRCYEEYTGLTSAELRERRDAVIHPDDLPRLAAAWATGESFTVQYRLRRADGVYRWHSERARRLPDDGWWLSTAVDVEDSKRAQQQAQFVELAGIRLSASLDRETTLETLLDLVVPRYGDWAVITLRDDEGQERTVIGRHPDPLKETALSRLYGHRWGRALASVTDRPAVVEGDFASTVRALGFESALVLPMVAAGEAIGAVVIVSADGRPRYGKADVTSLHEVARRAGVALANARLYEREHRVAAALQAAALPREWPACHGLSFDAHYRAGNQEALIGGDWFDAFTISGGRVVITIGDVAGSGLKAAVLMGNVRQLLRGAAHMHAEPAAMLDAADRTLHGDRDETMVTAFVGVIDPLRRTMSYASAGHPAPLIRRSNGGISELRASGLPLGCRADFVGQTNTTGLSPGSRLLLYTDGLVEWDRDILAGEQLLRERFARHEPGRDAKALVDAVLRDGVSRDDVAVLLVQFE